MEDTAKDSNKETSIDTTEHMSMDDLTILTESMGFSLVRAQKSLLNSSSGIEGAVDWLIKHQDDKDIDDPIIRVPHNVARLTSTNGELGVVEHYICNRCGKILSRANLDLHANLTGHSNFKESAQNTEAFADGGSKNILSKAQDVPTDGTRRDANMKKAPEKHRNNEQTNYSNQNTEERGKEARLRKAKVVQKDKKEERQRERERIKKQMEQDRYEFKVQQRSLQMNAAEDTEERDKEARLRKAKVVQKDKKEERQRERERIKKQMEQDRYEFKAQQRSLQMNAAEDTEERDKEARLRKAKIVQKDKKEERQRERERIKKQMERDRYEFKVQQRSLQMNVAEDTEERDKEARLRKAKIVQKDKKEERQRERERIKKQMERDRYEFKAQQRSLQMNVAEDTEKREKEARLRKAKIVQKDKKEERQRERERIMKGIERDRYEFKDEHGLLPPKRQYQTKDQNEGHPSVPKRKKTMYSEATIDKCIGNISSYKALDGRGCLQILAIYMRKILDNPSEDRYKRINMENKAYKTRVKPFVGAKALLLAVGFSLDERDNALILPDDANLEILATAKHKLEIAKDSY